MVKHGLSESTSRLPTEKGYGTSRLEGIVREHFMGDDFAALRGPAVRTLHAVMTDPNEAGSSRVMAASATLKLLADSGIEEDGRQSLEEIVFDTYVLVHRSALQAIKLYKRMGERAIALLGGREALVGPSEHVSGRRSLARLSNRHLIAILLRDLEEQKPLNIEAADAKWRAQTEPEPFLPRDEDR